MTCSRNDDKRAWDDLVEPYAPLVWSICRRHELSDADDADVNQNVWLQLMSQLDQIGHPAALPGWVATATRRECVRLGVPRQDRTQPDTCPTPRPSRTSTPRWPSRNC